jgi:hypothetical protein
MRSSYLLLIIFFFGFIVADAQSLLLVKKNKVIARFKLGDEIRLQLRLSKEFNSGIVTGIDRDFIVL